MPLIKAHTDISWWAQWFVYNFGLMGPGTRWYPYQWVQLQTYESRTLFFISSLQYHFILGLAEIKTLHPRDIWVKDAGCTGKKNHLPARGLSCGLSFHLYPNGSSKGSGESAHMRRLTRALAARWWDKYQNLVHWPIYSFQDYIQNLHQLSWYPKK